jgi:hypothetical protein
MRRSSTQSGALAIRSREEPGGAVGRAQPFAVELFAVRRSVLAAQTERANELTVALEVLTTEIVQKASSSAYHHQEPTSGCVIVPVGFQMLDHVRDSTAEQSDLNVGRTRVRRVLPVLFDDFTLYFRG